MEESEINENDQKKKEEVEKMRRAESSRIRGYKFTANFKEKEREERII